MSISNEALQKASCIDTHYDTTLTQSTAGEGDRVAVRRRAAADQPGAHPGREQAARDAPGPVDAQRDRIAAVRYSRVRGRRQDVRPPSPPIFPASGETRFANNETLGRFVAIPAPALQDKLGSQIKDIETEVDGMGKRLHYLETTAKNSQEHIEKMLKGGVQM
jgi:hypothetical protein